MGKIDFFYRKKKDVFSYQPWLIQKSLCKKLRIFLVENWKYNKNSLIFKLKGIKNREEIIKLKNYEIFFREKRLPNLNVDEYYWKDIFGCVVFNADGKYLGMVTNIIETGSNDVLIVLNKNREILIPFLRNQVIKIVNLKKKEIIVNWNINY